METKKVRAKHFFQVFLGMCFWTVMPADNFAADAGLDELRSRVTALEKKVDGLFSSRGEPQRKVTTVESNDNSVSENASQSPQYEEGPLLDVWLLESEDLKKIPNIPALGRMSDSSDLFNFGSFQTDDYLKKYYKNTAAKATGLLWTGFLKIDTPGTYLIIQDVEIQPVANGNGTNYHLYSRLRLGEKVVIENGELTRGGEVGGLDQKSTSLKLPKGLHKFELWLAGRWTQRNNGGGWGQLSPEPSNVKVRMMLREENSSKPLLITKALLLHKTNN